jgi:CheY-like chemotaxis protein
VAGAGFLLKPVSPEVLLEAVRSRLPDREGCRRVLVVDNDPVFCKQVREILGATAAVEVSEALDGRSALAQIDEQPPDLVLLDLMMPDVDGCDVLRALRLDKRGMRIPVIVVTGMSVLPEEFSRLERRLATLVHKREVSPDHIAEVVQALLAAAPACQPA